MRKDRQVAIVHFNTPELTEACINSIRKHGGKEYHVTVFDNSDKRPFTAKMDGVTVIDNTKGQVVDFDALLKKYPKCMATCNQWGSDKHMWSIQKLWEILPDGFVLMDSDILLKANIDFMWQQDQCAVGHVQSPQPGNRMNFSRLVPMLCYINVPLCKKHGLTYFDPVRNWMLHSKDMSDRLNWYDTGCSFFEDLHNHKNGARGRRIDIRPLMEHFKKGSWERTGLEMQKAWLSQHRKLWEPTPQMRGEKRVAICAIGRNENRYAVEWVEHYKQIGVAKIFVYDNYFGNETPLAETLKDYVADGFVEIIDIHDRPDLQCRAYEHCYKHHGDEYAWIGFLDFDEYLRWDGDGNIEQMFDRYQDGDCLLVNWRLFTDNGLIHYDPRPLKERFTEVMPLDTCVKYDFPENDHVKCFVRGGLGEVRFNGPHCPEVGYCINTRGERIQKSAFARPFDHRVMRLDHYWTKSADEWMNTKLIRGFASGHTYLDNFMKQQEGYFFAVNERTPIKEAILRGEKVPAPEPKAAPAVATKAKVKTTSRRDRANQADKPSKPKTQKSKNNKKQK
jgi:hypothetical protein